MSQKGQQPPADNPGTGSTSAGSGCSSEEMRQRVPALRGIFLEVLRTDALKRLLSAIEPLVRRVVKEEVELALANHLASFSRECRTQINPSCSGNLKLQFVNKLCLPVFTGTRIEGEDSSGLNIALVDGLTGEAITSGPESSMKVEIVVLEGDFEGNEEGNWTVEDFNSNIVKEREGKRSLLAGDVFVDLSNGIGMVGELSFSDNSSWTRSRKFRLGARAVDGYLNGIRVREARTEAFMVKDHRGELYKKHYPPLLCDEVWRLEKIGKDGAFHKRLSSEKVNTVKDFLTFLVTDAARLRNILGSGMSSKMWEITVEHARTCILTNQMHLYYPEGQQKTGVVFNVVGEVMGVLTNHQFISINDLSDAQKVEAKMLVKEAIQNREKLMAFDMEGFDGAPLQAFQGSIAPESHTIPEGIGNYYSSPMKTSEGFSFGYPGLPSPDIFARDVDAYSHNVVQGLGSTYEPESQACNPQIILECRNQQFFVEENLQYFDPEISLLSETLSIDSEADIGPAMASFITRNHWSPDYVWSILLLVMKWIFSIKKKVATRKWSYQKEKFIMTKKQRLV
ncbi:hypothetical protein HPP92_019438 [Vanilla planifolia]|uniref:Uncharacterized protein n=1 Tax=Vanilla planifolia TaxID=51239 RepID=A0A835Q422_VANPL|nr:hypothetical protein HPP92_019438 [Vanilla planifolia]